MAGSIALIGFGADSLIEAVAGFVVVWLFTGSRIGSSHAERRAQQLIAVSFYVLAAYVGVESVRTLVSGDRPQASWFGIGLAAFTALTMPLLARAKRHVGAKLGSSAAVKEASQTSLCAYLSVALLIGLGANALFGWWWADPLAALVIAAVALKEGRESWRGEGCADGCCWLRLPTGRARPSRGARRGLTPPRCLARREARVAPGREAADHVACTGEAELGQRRRREDRGAAVIAEQDDLVVEAANVRVAAWAVGIQAPFEHGAWNVERAGHDAVPLAVASGADVDQERPRRNGPVGLGRGVADDSLAGVREQVVEGASLDAGSHTAIMWLSAVTVQFPDDTRPPTPVPEGISGWPARVESKHGRGDGAAGRADRAGLRRGARVLP